MRRGPLDNRREVATVYLAATFATGALVDRSADHFDAMPPWSPDDFATLVDDVETKLFGNLADDTWFYPGHGDDSTLGPERGSIPEWRARGW